MQSLLPWGGKFARHQFLQTEFKLCTDTDPELMVMFIVGGDNEDDQASLVGPGEKFVDFMAEEGVGIAGGCSQGWIERVDHLVLSGLWLCGFCSAYIKLLFTLNVNKFHPKTPSCEHPVEKTPKTTQIPPIYHPFRFDNLYAYC